MGAQYPDTFIAYSPLKIPISGAISGKKFRDLQKGYDFVMMMDQNNQIYAMGSNAFVAVSDFFFLIPFH